MSQAGRIICLKLMDIAIDPIKALEDWVLDSLFLDNVNIQMQ